MLAVSAIAVQAQTSALDFDRNDCSGNNYQLFKMLDSGYVVLIEYVMIPNCSPCITAGKGIKSIVAPFETSHPGRVKVLQFGYSDSYTCSELQSWKSNNSFTNPIFDKGNTQVSYYGGMGMPTIVVVGSAEHKIYYKQQGYSPSDNGAISAAISEGLAASPTGIAEKMSQTPFTLYPSPASDMISIESEVKVSGFAVYDITGKEVLTATGASSADVSTLGSGIYVIQVRFADQTTGSQKFTKQ